jgi:hypothetical protein
MIVIGDRADDVSGARANGLRSVAVAWGYGDCAEIEAAQPDRIVASPAELTEYIRAVASERERSEVSHTSGAGQRARRKRACKGARGAQPVD